MKIQLIKDNVSEILTEEEKKTMELNLDRLKRSNYLFPVPLKEFFDLLIYHKLVEEKLKRGLFELRYDMEIGGKTTPHLITLQKNMITKQMVLNRDLTKALQREIGEQGLSFNVEEKIKMLKSFGANKWQILCKLVIPSNIVNLVNIIKINIGMSWVGVIMGEFIVSRAGIGYLVVYGSQIFKLDLVMMGVLVLAIIAYIMYQIINCIEKMLIKKINK